MESIDVELRLGPPWLCDRCGGAVKEVEHGWVEWLSRLAPDGGSSSEGLQLVHHPTAHNERDGDGHLKSYCQYNQDQIFAERKMTTPGDHLGVFLGADGLTTLLDLPRTERLPWEEVAEMIRRLHVPGYEHARPFIREAAEDGVIDDLIPSYFNQNRLRRIIGWARKQGQSIS